MKNANLIKVCRRRNQEKATAQKAKIIFEIQLQKYLTVPPEIKNNFKV